VRWQEQTQGCRIYLLSVYFVAIPLALLCFKAENSFSLQWCLFTLLSIFVATINVRLPKLSAIISMGDVFIIFILMRFGPGPALATYWIDIAAATITNIFRKFGFNAKGKIHIHKWIFNLACCSLSTWTMHVLYTNVSRISLSYPLNLVAALFSVAIGWFVVNTGSLSLALAFWMKKSFLSVWREGIFLYILNFLGSAAAAGLLSIFYDRVGFLVFVLSLPIAVILYQLYHFYIEK
jgi:hypothetical protein